MDEYYAILAKALRDRIQVIADSQLREQDPTGHLTKLREASERIEELKKKLPFDSDPMLAHYLDRVSLTKALEFIQSHYLR
jgi:hypothetical protein